MKIKVWADYSCPFCYIGKTLLNRAIEELKLEDVEIEYKAFLLDPNAPETNSVSTAEGLARKYRVSCLEAEQMIKGVILHAKSVGLHFRYDLVQATNTQYAHRLLKLVDDERKSAMSKALYEAYFVEGKNLSDSKDLIEISKNFGVKEETIAELFASSIQKDNLEADLKEAQLHRITGVPYFYFEDGTSIKGAQPLSVFIERLQST